MLLAALAFGLLEVLPVNFNYIWFALLLLLMGTAMGVFSSPNLAGIMNSLPPDQRGAGAGMTSTFQNSSQVLSIGVFFTLIILGLARSLPHSLYSGLVAQGVPADAARARGLAAPGRQPVRRLPRLQPHSHPARPVAGDPAADRVNYLTGRSFFPHLISAPFESGLSEAFTFAVVACLVAAAASWLRGGKYHHGDAGTVETGGPTTSPVEAEALALAGRTNGAAAVAAEPIGAHGANGANGANEAAAVAAEPTGRPGPQGQRHRVRRGRRPTDGAHPSGGHAPGPGPETHRPESGLARDRPGVPGLAIAGLATAAHKEDDAALLAWMRDRPRKRRWIPAGRSATVGQLARPAAGIDRAACAPPG